MDRTLCIEEERNGLRWKSLPNLTLHFERYLEEFRSIILPLVRPNWDPTNLASTVFDEGVTNKLVAIYQKSKGLKLSGEDVILLRINGQGTQTFINRDDEIVSFLSLNAAGLVPPFHLQLQNGLCYGFAVGRHVTLEEVREDAMMRRVCRAVAEMHLVPVPAAFQERQPQVWHKIDEWMKLVPHEFEDPDKQRCFNATLGSIETLKAEIEEMKLKLSDCPSPIQFCHNDLLSGNLIYTEKQDKVTLIDYEYGGHNYIAFDIADHFCEFAGIQTVDYSRYPGEELQKKWIRMYLEEKAKLKGQDSNAGVDISEDDVHLMYRHVNKFALTVHLFWTAWALLQAIHSTIDFDYVEYAGIRFTEYLKRKDEFLAL